MCFRCIKPIELLNKLSSKDIALWQAYDNLFPFGQQHTDFLLAQLTAVCFNLWKAKEVTPIDANIVLGKKVKLTEDYVMATLRTFNNGTN